jgi:RimJ/RimL family protein N-acetyltransferase
VSVVSPHIETERLRLRPFTSDDLDYIADVLSRSDVVRYLYWEALTRDEATEVLDRRRQLTAIEQAGDRLSLAVTLAETGEVVGDVVFGWEGNDHREAEIGFIFHPDHQGKGYAREACEAVLRIGFEDLDLHRVFGRCDARNAASAGLMERLGMRREAHFVDNEWVKGEWTSELVYAILDHEWRDQSVAR